MREGTSAGATRRWPKRVALGLALAALALLLDTAWAVQSVLGPARRAQESLQAGGDALLKGDLDGATARFAEAADQAEQAAAFGRHPSVWVGGLLPVIGDDVRAVRDLTRAEELAADAGNHLTAAAATIGWGPEGLSASASRGLDLGAIAVAVPDLDAAAAALGAADDLVSPIDPDRLTPLLADAVAQARETLTERTGLARAAATLGRLLPGMLGDQGPRRYLLALQNLSAPRGTGGFFGFYGALSADEGRLQLEALRPTARVPDVAPVDVPDDVQNRYARYGARTTLYASNFSPDVPTSSEGALSIAEAAGLGRYDGVLWVDTVWMASVLRATGEVHTPAWPEPVTGDNLVDILNRRTFQTQDPEASNRLQAAIGLAVWSTVLENYGHARDLPSAIADGVATRHLAVYAVDEIEQDGLEALGATASFTPATNPVAIVWQDAAANRAGYFASFDATQSVRLSTSGVAQVRATATMDNGAPTGPPSVLLGSGTDGVPVGWWGADVSFYLPPRASQIRTNTSGPSATSVEHEFGRQVATGFVYAKAGRSMTFTTAYAASGAATPLGEGWEYRTQIQPQPMLHPMHLVLTIQLPEGTSLTQAAEGMTIQGDTVTWEGATAEPLELWVRYA